MGAALGKSRLEADKAVQLLPKTVGQATSCGFLPGKKYVFLLTLARKTTKMVNKGGEIGCRK